MNCHEMKQDQVYSCRTCGLEIQVKTECCDSGKSHEDCGCECVFSCCEEPLQLKQ